MTTGTASVRLMAGMETPQSKPQAHQCIDMFAAALEETSGPAALSASFPASLSASSPGATRRVAAAMPVPGGALARLLRRLQARRKLALWRLYARGRTLAKRTLDVALVSLALLLVAPLLALVALLIRLGDGGPVLYWQKRVGLDGIEFDFPKFRSMAVSSDATRSRLQEANQHGSQGVTFKMRDDPRITRVGRFIRRFSIDELPQLWCVLKG